MEKALRRRVGADIVDIDTREGTAGYRLYHERRIDFEEIMQAADDAGYTLTGLTLEITGRISKSDCPSCQQSVSMLSLPGTGQRFELASSDSVKNLPVDGQVHITARALDWAGDHPRLDVVSVSEP